MNISLGFALLFLSGNLNDSLGFVTPAPPLPNAASAGRRAETTTRLFLDGEGMAGKTFNKHLLGDILRALQPRYLDQVKNTISDNLKGEMLVNVDSLMDFCNNGNGNAPPVPTWEELEARLLSQQSGMEKTFRTRLDQGLVHSPLASQRIFDERTNQEPIVTLYRDSASWCPYCQKVWMALEEKQIPYKVVKVDMNCYAGGSKPSSFLEIQPSGSLPCAVIHANDNDSANDNGGNRDGDQPPMVISQSDDILAILDKLNTSKAVPTLLPNEGTEEEEYVKFLCDDGRNSLERRLYAEWMWYLTGKRKPLEYRERYEAVLTEVEEELSRFPSGPYFMGGSSPSMADIKFVPFLERQAASLLYFKGYVVRDAAKFPNLCKWFDAMESRPSYSVTRSDIYTHSRALPPQLGGNGCTYGEGHELMKEAVDAYCVPTKDANKVSEFALEWREEGWKLSSSGNGRFGFGIGSGSGFDQSSIMARREAAERIMSNRENICKFAARGAGTAGFPPASAELADPKAISNEIMQYSVDVFLRYTIGLLLSNDDRSKREMMNSLEAAVRALALAGTKNKNGDGYDREIALNTAQATVDCLDYLRQRIGVPRDMTYPAAQELRQTLLEVSSFVMNHALIREESEARSATKV